MTRQEMFDMAYCGVMRQGGPSVDPDNRQCLYRAPGGKKCAAGWLIPDEAYSEAMEGVPIEPVHLVAMGLPKETEMYRTFVREMQRAHDVASWQKGQEFLDAFTTLMRAVAVGYNLNTDVMKEFE